MKWIELLLASVFYPISCLGSTDFTDSVEMQQLDEGDASFIFTDVSGATGTASFYDGLNFIYLDGTAGVVDIQCVTPQSQPTQIIVTFDSCADALAAGADTWQNLVAYTTSQTSGCLALPGQFDQIARFTVYGTTMPQNLNGACDVKLTHQADNPLAATTNLRNLNMVVQRPVTYQKYGSDNLQSGQFLLNMDIGGSVINNFIQLNNAVRFSNLYVSAENVQVIQQVKFTFDNNVIVDAEDISFVTHTNYQMGFSLELSGDVASAAILGRSLGDTRLGDISFLNIIYSSGLGQYFTLQMSDWEQMKIGMDMTLTATKPSILGVSSKLSRAYGLNMENRDFQYQGTMDHVMYSFMDFYAFTTSDASFYDANYVFTHGGGMDVFVDSRVTFRSGCRWARAKNIMSVKPFYAPLLGVERFTLPPFRKTFQFKQCLAAQGNNLVSRNANFPNL